MPPKKKAANNRTVDLTELEIAAYAARLKTLHGPTTTDEIKNTTICQNLFDAMKFLPDHFADLIIADPPYNMVKDHRTGFERCVNIADVMAWLEETYFVMDVDSGDLKTVHDVMAAAVGSVKSGTGEPPVQTPEAWAENPERPEIELPDPGQYTGGCG